LTESNNIAAVIHYIDPEQSVRRTGRNSGARISTRISFGRPITSDRDGHTQVFD
jgi:hypothetical protein